MAGVLDKSNINGDEHVMLDVIEDDIVMSFDGIAIKSINLKAGKSNMQKAIDEALSSSSNQIFRNENSFSYSMQELSSYKDVEFYLGQTIDTQKWFGVAEGKRIPKTLLALNMARTAFTVHIDLPSDGSFAVNSIEVAKHKLEDLLYVNSISFGRRVLVLIESNVEAEKVNRAIKNMLEDNELSDQDKHIMANCTFRAVGFGDEEIVLDPDLPLSQINQYVGGEITKDNYGLPISFSGAYLKDNRVFENSY